MRIIRILFSFLPLLFSLLYVSSVSADDHRVIVLAYPEEVAKDREHLSLIDELHEAFDRAGYEMRHEYYPEARCRRLADSGEIDGLPSRVRDFNSAYTNLVRVNIPVDVKEFAAYTNRTDLTLEGWDSLAGRDLRIIYLNGVFIVEKRLSESVAPSQLTAVGRRIPAMKMLLAGRADIFIDITHLADLALSRNDKVLSGIRKAGTMERDEHFLFLHKKHSALVPELEKVMNEMKTEGYFQ